MMGEIDALTVMTVVRQHLPPLEAAVRDMLTSSSLDEPT